ncbi:hypothetical protein Tco_0103740 [Tanacetum coccineum]
MDLPKMIREQTVEFIDSQEIDRKINESVKEVVISSVKHAMRAPLRARFKDLPTSDMKEILLQRMLEENYDKGHAASDSVSSTHQGGQSTSTAALSSSKTAASAEYSAWTMTDTRIKPSIITIPDELYMDDETTADEQAYSSSEEVGRDHIPTVNLRQRISELTPKDLEGPAYEIVKVFHPDVVHLQFQMEECHKLLTDKVDDAILKYNVSKPLPLGGEPALSISKIKAAFYLDVGLEQLVPDQFWIEEECKYDIAAMYGISHWWFQRQRFYIDRFSSEGDRRAVRTHMRILSVVRIEVFSLYGYNYMKKIILRRADLKEYVIAERDFKYMYPSDFEDLYLLNLQGYLNHLSPNDKKTQLNLTKPRWDATEFEFKPDYTVIDSPRAVTFRDRYGVQMIMRFNEIHKFSDGTLQQIDEALDYRVKEFRVNRTNPGMNTRFWMKKDVVRSKEFMFAIQKRLKTRRIFQMLESFVGGRIRRRRTTVLLKEEPMRGSISYLSCCNL